MYCEMINNPVLDHPLNDTAVSGLTKDINIYQLSKIFLIG